MTKYGVIGSGVVGGTLANGLLKLGNEVMRGSREPSKLEEWRSKGGKNASTGSFADAAKFGETIVLAVSGAAAISALDLVGAENLAGKTIIDTTNPISGAPVNGVLPFFTGPNDSLMERMQQHVPAANFVKAFSSVGAGAMVDPDYGGLKPTMFIAGNDAGAKAEVTRLLDGFGWETADMGPAEAARAIEPLCILWCIPGFQQNSWLHAFKLLRK